MTLGALGTFPELLTCDHAGEGGRCTGVLAFRRPPKPDQPEVNVMLALCPVCTDTVYESLKHVVPLEPQRVSEP